MMEKCADILVEWLIKSEVIKKEEKEIYVYAAYSLFLSIAPVLMAVILGIVMGQVLHSVILILPFMLIRKFSGGYHSKNNKKCLIYSWGILFMFTYVACQTTWNIATGFITILAIVHLFVFSPIDSENRKLAEDEQVECKKWTIIWVMFWVVIVVVLLFLGLYSYANCAALGMIMTASLQIPCTLKKFVCQKSEHLIKNQENTIGL